MYPMPDLTRGRPESAEMVFVAWERTQEFAGAGIFGCLT